MECGRVNRSKTWETNNILRMIYGPKMKAGDGRGGVQKEDFEGDEGHLEEDEITYDDREDCGNGVEDHCLRYLRRRRSSHERVTNAGGPYERVQVGTPRVLSQQGCGIRHWQHGCVKGKTGHRKWKGNRRTRIR